MLSDSFLRGKKKEKPLITRYIEVKTFTLLPYTWDMTERATCLIVGSKGWMMSRAAGLPFLVSMFNPKIIMKGFLLKQCMYPWVVTIEYFKLNTNSEIVLVLPVSFWII